MKADEVYRHIVVRLSAAGIVAPKLSNLGDHDYTKAEAEQLAKEAVDYIDARLKHSAS